MQPLKLIQIIDKAALAIVGRGTTEAGVRIKHR